MNLKTNPALDRAPVIEVAPVVGDIGLVWAFVKGSLIGFVVLFALLGGLVFAVGLGAGVAVGVGLFTAAWGGPGFGGMLGAVLHYSKAEGS
jgi:hypothetical protein